MRSASRFTRKTLAGRYAGSRSHCDGRATRLSSSRRGACGGWTLNTSRRSASPSGMNRAPLYRPQGDRGSPFRRRTAVTAGRRGAEWFAVRQTGLALQALPRRFHSRVPELLVRCCDGSSSASEADPWGWAVPGSNGRPPACKARAAAAVYCRPSLERLHKRSSAPGCCRLLRFAASRPLPQGAAARTLLRSAFTRMQKSAGS